MAEHYFVLADLTRFYASGSVIYRPELQPYPVAVCAGQGIIIAQNRQSSLTNIRKFKPIWEEIGKINHHGGKVFQCNFNTLGHISQRYSTLLREVFKGHRVFEYSVDESMIEISSLKKIGVDLTEYLQQVRKTIFKQIGVGCGIGAGRTLTIMKLASWAAKNLPGYNGICILDSLTKEQTILKAADISEVWNIGSQLTKHLTAEGIKTAWDLAQCDPQEYRKKYSINVANTINELNGISVLGWDDFSEPKQNIYSTSSYRDRLNTPVDVYSEIAYHCTLVMQKLRAQNSQTLAIEIFVATSRFDNQRYYQNKILKFEVGISDTGLVLNSIENVISELLPDSLKVTPIYKVGVGAISIIRANRQSDLFSVADNRESLNNTIDNLNARFGKGTIRPASVQNRYTEKMGSIKFEKLDNYLTDINHLITVQCI